MRELPAQSRPLARLLARPPEFPAEDLVVAQAGHWGPGQGGSRAAMEEAMAAGGGGSSNLG